MIFLILAIRDAGRKENFPVPLMQGIGSGRLSAFRKVDSHDAERRGARPRILGRRAPHRG